ncbi:MAG: kelch repeat-containing protein [Pseudomonadota bacterium]
MAILSRRAVLAGGASSAGAFLTAGLSGAFAHDSTAPMGAWSPLANMPFPVQEIYPAPFWRASSNGADRLKQKPFNIIVNAGGLTPDFPHEVTDKVTYYDPLYDAWGYGTSLPAPRHHIALVNSNGFLYALGGFARNQNGGWQNSADCWRIDRINSEWRAVRPLPHPQSETVCASLAGFVHVVGGRAPAGSANAEWRDHIDTDEHWLYDPLTDRWEALAPMPTARNSAAGAVVGGVLYVMGGRTVRDGNLTAMEAYDPLSNRWSRAKPMPKAQAGLAAGVIDGKIYAFGGEFFGGGGGVFAEAWEYDPARDDWRAVAAMPRKRHGLGAVSLDGAIYALGGAAKVGGDETTMALDKFEI